MYTITTHQGEAAVFAIATKYNLAGYSFTMQVSDFDNFASPTNVGTFNVVDGKLVVTLSATEVDAITDAYFRIQAVGSNTFYLAGGNIAFIPASNEQVHPDDLDENGYLKELSEGIEEHTHMANDIENASTIGRNIIVATSAADVRALIGAGTSSIQLGTTPGTAKVGDYQPTAEDITNATTVGRNVLKASSAAVGQSALGINAATKVLPGLMQIGGDLDGTAVSQVVAGLSLANIAFRTATFTTDAEIFGDFEDGPEVTIQMPRAGRVLVLFQCTVRQPNQALAVQDRGLVVAIYGKDTTSGAYIIQQDPSNEIYASGTGAAETITGFRLVNVPSGPITFGMVYRSAVYTGAQAEFSKRYIMAIPC